MNPRRLRNIAGQAISVLIPVGTMIGMHVNWESSRNGKLRMLLKHVGFWLGMTGTLLIGHRYGFRAKTMMGAAGVFLAASPLPIVGYLAAKKVAPMLFPRQAKPTADQSLDAFRQKMMALMPPEAAPQPSSQPVSPAPAQSFQPQAQQYWPQQTTYPAAYSSYGNYRPYPWG